MSKLLSRDEISNLVADIRSRDQIEKSALEKKNGNSIGSFEIVRTVIKSQEFATMSLNCGE